MEPLRPQDPQFCVENPCSACRYGGSLFWRSVPPHLLPVVALLRLAHPKYIAPDWDLIRGVCQAQSEKQRRDEFYFFSTDLRNRTWLRGRMRLRISARRLQDLLEKSRGSKDALGG